jgi:hypothetical protein
MTPQPIRRCAVYTRISFEEGLEQSFNSLHAQREACEAYIKSQAHEGWKLIKTAYDDGGFSGGNLERPALSQAATVIGQMSDADLALCTGARRDCFGRFLANAMAGDTVTPDEAQHLKKIQQLLRLSDNDLGSMASRITRAEALGRIDAGILPEVTNPPINLQFGVKANFVVAAQLLEERVVGRRYEGGSRGVSFRIMKGVSYTQQRCTTFAKLSVWCQTDRHSDTRRGHSRRWALMHWPDSGKGRTRNRPRLGLTKATG